MNRQTDRWTNGWKDGRTGKETRVDGQIDGWKDKWGDGRMEERANGLPKTENGKRVRNNNLTELGYNNTEKWY